jgi:hypothetical protein
MEAPGRAEATITKARWLIDFARSDIGLRPITSSAKVPAIKLTCFLKAREWMCAHNGPIETAPCPIGEFFAA